MNSWPPPPGELPALAPAVHVWAVRLDDERIALARGPTILSADERDRAARFIFERDRRRYLVAHIALHDILGRYLAIDPATLSFAIGANGKPSLPAGLAPSGLHFNLSHSNEMALLAICLGRELGVDVECVKSDFDFFELAEHYFTSREVASLRGLPADLQRQAFFKCWTSKEAFLKAKGTGLSGELDEVEISLANEQQVRIDAAVPGWSLTELPPIDGYEAALVIEDERLPIRSYVWEPCLQVIG